MGETNETARGTVFSSPSAPDHDSEEALSMATAKSTKAPAFQFYPKDFLLDRNVRTMSMTERGIYITLLSLCWLDNGLPTDPAELASDVGVKPQQFARMWAEGRLRACFYEKDGRLQHKRLDEERKKQADFRRRQTDKATKRWDKSGNATASVRHRSGNALRSSSSTASSKKDASTEQKHHAVKAFLTEYESLFEGLSGNKPVITSRDARIAKETIARVGEPKAIGLVQAFFASSDPFIQKSGYGLNVFSGQINKLLIGERTGQPTLTSSKTAGNVDVLRRFVERGKPA